MTSSRRAVYDALLGCLGLVPTVDFSDPEGDSDDTGTVAAVGYGGADGRLMLWLVAGPAATSGAQLALAVTEPELVQEVHEAARRAGIPVVQAPRDWGVPPAGLLRNPARRPGRQPRRGAGTRRGQRPSGDALIARRAHNAGKFVIQ